MMDFIEKLKSMSPEQRRNLAYIGGLSCGKTAMQHELLRFYADQHGVKMASIEESKAVVVGHAEWRDAVRRWLV